MEHDSPAAKTPVVFLTTITGIGPWCLECSDGEIVTSRSYDRIMRFAATEAEHDKILSSTKAEEIPANDITE